MTLGVTEVKINVEVHWCSALMWREGEDEVRQGAEKGIAHTEGTNFGLLPTEKEVKSTIKQEPTEKKDFVLESEKDKPKSRAKKTATAVS